MADDRQSYHGQSTREPASDARAIGIESSHSSTAPFLDQAQQSLLLAALNSQIPLKQDLNHSLARDTLQSVDNLDHFDQPQHSDTFKQEPDSIMGDPDFTPDLLDIDDSFDFDNADLGGSMIGGIPGDEDGYEDADHHEKRKADDDDMDNGDAKRQEASGSEKGAKKPGRKPLTNEPTTKRKAQNRAAQRAFRERKEAHLKDLETKVTELTKAQEADKHENGLLKAQVDRLQTELREYRKRLSLNSTSVKRSPTLPATQSSQQMSFQFDFPKFGSLPTSQILGGSNSITPPLTHSPASTSFSQNGELSRNGSEARSMSPQTQFANTRSSSLVSNVEPTLLPYSTSDNMHGFASTLPQMGKSANDPFGDLFSPSILKSVSHANGNNNNNYFANPVTTTTNGGDSTAGIPDNRVFRFNSTSISSDTASPSASSLSHGNTADSSCGTSPEPSNESPATKLKQIGSTQQKPQYSFAQLPQQPTNDLTTFSDAYSVPQVDSFDPVLFGDYRDTNDNVVGDGDFSGGFFDDTFNPTQLDWASPSNVFGGLSPSMPQQNNATTPSHNLMAEIDKASQGLDDVDYGLASAKAAPADKSTGLISCTKIWSQLQSNPDFQDGKFDLDGLCSELRTKARCSESGLMVDAQHVDAALKNFSQKDFQAKPSGGLMFPQETWDNALQRHQSSK